MFEIEDVFERKDGSFDIYFKTPTDWETFKKMAKDQFNRKKYTEDLGNKYFSYVVRQGLETMEKDNGST